MAEEAQPTYFQRLKTNDDMWEWKTGLRVFLCIVNIVALGSIAWVIGNNFNQARNFSQSDRYNAYTDSWTYHLGLAPVVVSLIWCLIVILVLLLRKKPVHPGAVVGIDLILWLGFLILGLFATAAIFSEADFGSGDEISDPSYSSNYSGHYIHAPNGTWVYNITSADRSSRSYHYNRTTGEYEYDTPSIANVTRDCTPQFETCAEQDQWINDMWNNKSRRTGIEITGNVCEYLAVLLHFILFVWACVDVNRRNRLKYANQAGLVAEKIILDMQQRGHLTLHQPITQPLLQEVSRSAANSVRNQSIRTQEHGAPQEQAPMMSGGAGGPGSRRVSNEDAIEQAPRQPAV